MAAPSRQTSYVILGAYTALPLLLLFVTFTRTSDQAPSLPAAAVYALSLGSLVGAILVSCRIQASADRMQYNTNMLGSLALSELASLISFACIGLSDWKSYVPVAVGSVVVNLLFIAPRIAAYWNR